MVDNADSGRMRIDPMITQSAFKVYQRMVKIAPKSKMCVQNQFSDLICAFGSLSFIISMKMNVFICYVCMSMNVSCRAHRATKTIYCWINEWMMMYIKMMFVCLYVFVILIYFFLNAFFASVPMDLWCDDFRTLKKNLHRE